MTLLNRINQDPIPADAIDTLCRLVKSAYAHHRSKGRDTLADLVGVTPTTVRRWVNGESACFGANAEKVREVARRELGN